MVDRIAEARRIVATASDATDDAVVREQLQSIDQGLAAVATEPDDAVKGGRLEEIESKLVGLGNEVDDEAVLAGIEDARDHVDAIRRNDAQDW